MNNNKCFFAYPSNAPSREEIIETAIEKLNSGKFVEVIGWKKISITGKLIAIEIFKEIDNCSIFLCDLTSLNNNVLFELGYAIARKKRIFCLLDTKIEKAKSDFDKFNIITSIGYSPYSNTSDIINEFYKNEPYNDLKNTVYRQAIEPIINKQSKSLPTLFYLKSAINTESSIQLTRRVNISKIKNVIDDPLEVRMQPLSWYVEEVTDSFCVIAHLLSQEHEGHKQHNTKISFISGLAFGLGIPLLMLAHEPFEPLMDYKELLKAHKTAAKCYEIADQWLGEQEAIYIDKKKDREKFNQEIKAQTLLEKISIGNYIAEQEQEEISKYFVETSAYKEALDSTNSIFIGRKGSGKTAILFKLKNKLSEDKRNHVCLITPIGYELEGLVSMMNQSIRTSEKGFLTESVWKFLVYTELTRSIYEVLSEKPTYYDFSKPEKDLMELVEQNCNLIKQDFSIRLEYAIDRVKNIDSSVTVSKQRTKISELLHEEIISKFRKALGIVLNEKNRVFILIDNLDKNWKQGTDLKTLSYFLLGLLSVSQRICDDFKKSDNWRMKVKLSIVIFLREDIFSYIMKYARESDKIGYKKINWDDQLLLLRIIEERFSSNEIFTPKGSEIWKTFFCPNIGGIETKNFIIQNIIPRPRDIIYVVRTALANAINHKNALIEEEDIIDAQKKYSQYALNSLLVENGISLENFENLLYEFAGMPEIVNENEIYNIMKKCSIPLGEEKNILDLLCDRTFIGREIESNDFRFQYNTDDSKKYEVMSRKTAENSIDKLKRFKINKAFHSYLEIKSSN